MTGPLLAVVGQAGRDVRVMMLDADQVHPGQLGSVLRGQVLRVQVVRDHLGGDVEQPPEVLDALGERPQGLEVLQVADVLRDERTVLLGQAERVLQLGAAGQYRPSQQGAERERLRHVAAGPADQRRPGRGTRGPPSRRS